jgi:hypothetical protein
MELILQRGIPGVVSQPGELFIQNTHAAYTLENLADHIPAGRYKVTLYPSPHFKRLMLGRTDILIHWGNHASDYRGCIGVGEMRDLSTEEIFNTVKAFSALFPAIEAAVENEGCWITLKDSSQPQANQAWPSFSDD